MNFADLISLDSGYVIKDQHSHFPEQTAGNKGDVIFPTYADAVVAYFEKKERDSKSKINNYSFSASTSYLYENVYIIKVDLPNCWLYDTEPTDYGDTYLLKVCAKGVKVANYDPYEANFKEIDNE